MISLCPACKAEQMVTAIALQENRGVVHCEACTEPFKPRAHRVTSARERAFKQRLKDLQLAMAAAPEEAVHITADYIAGGVCDGKDQDQDNAKQDDSNAAATDRLIEELGGSMKNLRNPIGTPVKVAADVIEQNKSLPNSEPEMLVAKSKPKSKSKSKRLNRKVRTSHANSTGVKEKSAAVANASALAQAKKPVETEPVKRPSKPLSPEKIQRQRLRKARHAIARQKLVLEYEKLKVENEKLEFEKKKLELEKVKFEIMAKHKLLEVQRIAASANQAPALDGRTIVEYDIKTDLLPRTPNAINRGGKSAAENREKVHLELLPNEPGRVFRKNLSSKSKNIRAK